MFVVQYIFFYSKKKTVKTRGNLRPQESRIEKKKNINERKSAMLSSF